MRPAYKQNGAHFKPFWARRSTIDVNKLKNAVIVNKAVADKSGETLDINIVDDFMGGALITSVLIKDGRSEKVSPLPSMIGSKKIKSRKSTS